MEGEDEDVENMFVIHREGDFSLIGAIEDPFASVPDDGFIPLSTTSVKKTQRNGGKQSRNKRSEHRRKRHQGEPEDLRFEDEILQDYIQNCSDTESASRFASMTLLDEDIGEDFDERYYESESDFDDLFGSSQQLDNLLQTLNHAESTSYLESENSSDVESPLQVLDHVSKSQKRKQKKLQHKQQIRDSKLSGALREQQALDNLSALLGYRAPPKQKSRYAQMSKTAAKVTNKSIVINPKLIPILNSVNQSFISFMDSETEELRVAPMPAPLRKVVEQMADKYAFKYTSRGSGMNKCVVVIKTRYSFLPNNHSKIPKIVLEQLKSKINYDLEDKQKRKKPENNNRRRDIGGLGKPEIGSVVGANAEKVGEGNVGHSMMLKMGWKPGDGIGSDAGRNLEPIQVVVRGKRTGLGAE